MSDTVLLTGGSGFLGKNIHEKLRKQGFTEKQILAPSSKELDLRHQPETMDYFKRHRPTLVINSAARLGGIGDNRAHPASYFYDNMTIGLNVIEASRTIGVRKLVNIGTVCSYPKFAPIPFREENLWDGYPEETNGAYGIAKKSVFVYADAVHTQYGLDSVNVLLTNLYGPGDDFREETSHVIPALIRKMDLAREKNESKIAGWGDGSPTRDFLYVADAAEGIVQSLMRAENSGPFNLGSGNEISIRQLFELLRDLVRFNGEIEWDHSKPNGQPKRFLNIDRARSTFGFDPKTSFAEGLEQTVKWYFANKVTVLSQEPKYTRERDVR